MPKLIANSVFRVVYNSVYSMFATQVYDVHCCKIVYTGSYATTQSCP